MRHWPWRVLAPAMAALATGCSAPQQETHDPPAVVEESGYVEQGDFDAIQRHGRLRLLVQRRPGEIDHLPRAGSPVDAQIRAAARFAHSIGLEPVVVLVDRFEQLVPALAEGRGDVIVANLTIDPELREDVAFTVALDRTRQILVARADDPIEQPAQLGGRSITVGFGSRYWDTAQRLQQAHPGLLVESLPGLTPEKQLDLLARGTIDLTLLDSNTLETALEYRDDVRGVFPVSPEKGVGWGVRANAPQLRNILNRFVAQRKLVQFERERRTGDLPVIKRSRTLRVATRNSAANYFVWRGQLLGFEYELAQRFADRLGVRLEVVVADSGEALLPMVRDGRADVAAAFLAPAAGRDDQGIAWSRPYHHAVHQVVTDARDRSIRGVDDLHGRTFVVGRDSDAWALLEQLREQRGIGLELRAAPAGEEPETIITKVGQGTYDLTLADDHIVRTARVWNDRVRAVLDLGEPVAHRWAVRSDNDALLAAVDRYLTETYRGEFYNVVYAKYFKDHERIQRFQAQRVDLEDGRQLSPYDDLIRGYAKQYGFDWRLLAAQMYQESGFDPESRSWAGARGLMQVMPRTARQVGIAGDLSDPETNVRAGVRYLDWLRDRFEEELSVQDRMWFTLAAFNAGTGHVRDARRLASRMGLDPDRWFDNVELAMLKLSEPKYYQRARFGYVRGREPVKYVRSIRERYQAYILWTDDCWPSCQESPHPQVAGYTRPAPPAAARMP